MKHFISKFIFVATLSAAAFQATAADLESEKAVKERVAILEKAWEKADVGTIVSQVWGSDAIIHGEGQPAVVNTPEGIKETIKHLTADTKKVKIDIYKFKELSNDSALTWVTWNVTPKDAKEKPFKVKSLFVWTKEKDGWRIRADMYSMGSM